MTGGKKVLKRKTVLKNSVNNQVPIKKLKMSLNGRDSKYSNEFENPEISKSNSITANNKSNFVSRNPPHRNKNVSLKVVQDNYNKPQNESVMLEKLYSCQYCDFQTCFYNLLTTHQRRHNRQQPFACSRCSLSYSTIYSLRRHINIIHGKPPNIFCNECDFRCSKQLDLKSHMRIHSNKNYFKCSTCDFKQVQECLIRRHMIKHLDNKFQLLCTFCTYKGVKPEYVTKHMKKHHKFELDFQNSYGEPNISDTIIENIDINSCRKGKPIVLLRRCDEDINGGCNSAVNLGKIHEQVLQDNFFDVAKCGVPEETIDSELLNSLHQQDDSSVLMKSTLITKSKNIITSIVKVVDNDQSNRLQPLNIRVAKTGIRGKNKRQLQSKQAASVTETVLNPLAINEITYNKTDSKTADVYQCVSCPFVSTWRDRFETHVKLHEKKNFSCDSCDFVTNSKKYLTRHKRLIHCKTKEYKCEKCDHRCWSPEYLRIHMKCHDKVKRFKCDQCNFSTNLAGNLKNHMGIHNAEKPFACDLCDFRTRSKTTLRNHQFVHTGETKYVCEICNYKFYSNGALKKHMKVHQTSK